jgi:hypothetical protein
LERFIKAHNGAKYDPDDHFKNTGYNCIDVLPFLTGKQFDDVALAYIHSLRPTSIRVSIGSMCLDARTWRVTVHLDKDTMLILKIEQEIEVGLPDWCKCGSHLNSALNYGKGSDAELWERNDFTHQLWDFNGNVYGFLADDTKIPHPLNK